jgi:1,4-dihydroxy-2-naphthoyl-CoA synthase
MDRALIQWADDPSIELVVVDHAAGTRGFCAGGDIRMLAESGAGDGNAAAAFFRERDAFLGSDLGIWAVSGALVIMRSPYRRKVTAKLTIAARCGFPRGP